MTFDVESAPGLGPWRGAGPPADFEPFPAEAVQATVGERFATVAAAHPDRLAVRSPSGAWTYRELSEEVARVAGGVVRLLGSRTGQPVALLADHDGPLVAAVIGIISAGQVVVILDPAAPAEQTADVLAEAGPTLLLHDAANSTEATTLAAVVASESRHRTKAIELSELHGDFDGPAPLGWHAPFMLAFTSGTSGGPKGAIINHGVLLNLVRGSTDALGIGPDDRMPMLFPTSLAVAAYPMFLPLLNGGTLATLDVRSVGLAPVADFLVDERITLAYMAPTVVRFLVDSLEGRTFPDLRMVALGGELVDPEILAVTARLFGCDHVAIGYGTTETGVVSLAVHAADDLPDESVTCGHSVPDVDVVILDDDGVPLEGDASGEVAVVSRYLFDGYWGHPELNRQVLTNDPRGATEHRCYRSGDLGRIDEHGALVLLGRSDTKVKVRGRFVVLGDVEADLHELDSVADAIVTARVVDGVTELIAHVVPTSGEAVAPVALRSALLERREAYRVPTRWVLVDELPRLPNGKSDRRALPSPDLVEAAGDPGAASMDPAARDHTMLRRIIRELWEQLLPVGTVGVDEDFYDLGGDSLLAAQMLVMLEGRTGVIVPMGELVHARTIRDLAEVVARLDTGSIDPVSTATCVQHGDLSARPRLWFVHDLQGSAYRVRHLADALGPDQPVWSFESPLLAGEPNLYSTLDTFAARYLTDLRAVQPEGPYWLAGYSFGGICAYEMARQLERDGEEVAFVGVVDVGPGYRGAGWHGRHSPTRPWFGVAKPPEVGASFVEQLRHYSQMFSASRPGTARHLMVRSGLARYIDPRRFRSDLRHDGRVRPEWRLWYAWEEHWKLAATAWDRSNPYDGSIDLFWAESTASADATMGWSTLVDEVRVHRFDGDHMGILEERGAPQLASALRDVLDRRLDPESGGDPDTEPPEESGTHP